MSDDATLPDWLGKPLYSMSTPELEQIRAALDKEVPDDVALVEAVLYELARRTPGS